jgi:ubiquinone/menaquinone biosynthesis C-methylase UbiE
MNDLDRLRHEYEDRKRRFADKDVYSRFNLANLFTLQQRERSILSALEEHGLTNVSALSILEMGCGAGGVLTEFLNLGASPRQLYGMDLLSDRLVHAHEKLPTSHFVSANGGCIPFPMQTFDLVMQFTALSSILDTDLHRQISKEMLRVLKPNGLLLWYDFWLNPTNPQTRGIRPTEIRELFPNCAYEFHRITLAPPIARRLVPISWPLALFLEGLKLLNTHYLVAIRPLITGN